MTPLSTYLFYLFAALVVISAVAAVTTRRILRAAVYLLFVLGGTAAFFFMVNYYFLAAVQLLVYAGGIVVLIIFSILLTSDIHEKLEQPGRFKIIASLLVGVSGMTIIALTLYRHSFAESETAPAEVTMKSIGKTLLSYSEGGYVLPFEVISIVLLAAMAGAIVIAKRNPSETS